MERSIQDSLVDAVRRAPGSTARELVRDLRSRYRSLSKRDINPILYHSDHLFLNDGGYIPRWYPAGATVAAPDDERSAITDAIRALHSRRDARHPSRARFDGVDIPPVELPIVEQVTTPQPGERLQPIDWCRSTIVQGLRPWQIEALTLWCDAGGRGVVEAVTGTGKTHLGIEAACQMHARGGQTTVLVPSVELQRQWFERFDRYAPQLTVATIGGESGGNPRTDDVTVAVVNTAVKQDLTSGGRTRLIVADEVHRYGSETFRYALRPGYEYRLGLTATFERTDSGLEDALLPYFGAKVFDYDYSRAVPEHVVAPFTLAFLGVSLTEEEREEYDHLSHLISRHRSTLAAAGVFSGPPQQHQAALARAKSAGGRLRRAAIAYENSTRQRRNVLADSDNKIEAVVRLGPAITESNGSVVFTQRVAPAEDIAYELRACGIEAAAVHSRMDAQERRDNLDRLGDRSIQALCAPKILDEGIDIPNIDLGIVVSASRGRRQMIQRLGRVIRLKEDGHHARFIILFARDTVEDPANGALEGFVSMVEDAAERCEVLHSDDWNADDVREALQLHSEPVVDLIARIRSGLIDAGLDPCDPLIATTVASVAQRTRSDAPVAGR